MIGFLNMALDNTVKKNKQKTSLQPYKTFLFLYYYHVFLCCETNKKKVLQKEIKDLTHEAFDRFTYFF